MAWRLEVCFVLNDHSEQRIRKYILTHIVNLTISEHKLDRSKIQLTKCHVAKLQAKMVGSAPTGEKGTLYFGEIWVGHKRFQNH